MSTRNVPGTRTPELAALLSLLFIGVPILAMLFRGGGLAFVRRDRALRVEWHNAHAGMRAVAHVAGALVAIAERRVECAR